MKLTWLKPDRSRMTNCKLHKLALDEAIGLLVLEGVFETESAARRKLYETVKAEALKLKRKNDA